MSSRPSFASARRRTPLNVPQSRSAAIDCNRNVTVSLSILFYPILLYSTLPHSHSIVLTQDNALIHRPTISTAAISGERQSHFLLEPRFR